MDVIRTLLQTRAMAHAPSGGGLAAAFRRLLALASALVLVGSPQPALAWFEDFTERAGISFRYVNGADGRLWFPEIMGGGVAVLDYDGDGWLDLYFVQGGAIGPGIGPADRTLGDRLYRNVTAREGRLAFEDVTRAAAIDARGYGQGVAVGDVDGDGDPDVYVLNFGPNQLWRNDGDGTFTDVTGAAAVGDPRWSIGATFADLAGDGDLDLYVVNYVDYALDRHRDCHAAGSGRLDYCSPSAYGPIRDTLYANDGSGAFRDVTADAGIADAPQPGLGVVSADFDGDGRLDLYVANDGKPNQFWLNQGDLTFRDEALLAGNAVNFGGSPEAGMGVATADFDRDGSLDLFVTHLVQETNTLYANDGQGWFRDVTAQVGLGQPSLARTGFGTGFADFDLDGWLDLFVANGHVTVAAELVARGDPWPYHQPDQLFANRAGRFVEVTDEAGAALAVSRSGRGVAFGDLDNDGAVDVVVANNDGAAQLLRNRVGVGRRWLGVDPRDGRGRPTTYASVWLLDAQGRPAWFQVARTDGSYGAARDHRLVFALGDGTAPGSLEVHWPDGRRERFEGLASGRYHVLRRGQGRAP